MLEWPEDKIRKADFYLDIMDQAERQNRAAEGCGVDWHFADGDMAHFFSREFKDNKFENITVFHTEAVVKKIEEVLVWFRENLSGALRALRANFKTFDILRMQEAMK